jgi:hypothetical protein
MPIKRRREKARRQIDDEDMEDLFYGPGTALLEGYCTRYSSSRFDDLSPSDQAAVIEDMRQDWQRQSADVLAAWRSRTEHDLYIAREYFNDPEQPWALTQFGEPQ